MSSAAPNGVELYYERHGDSGEPLVLVHGFTGDITDWRHQIEAFAPTYRLLVLDNRGHGRSSAPAEASGFDVALMARDAAALAEQVGFDRYHLVGHSMGGVIAQEMALRHPETLLSLTLQDTTFSFRDFRPRLPDGPPLLPQHRLDEIAARFGRMSPDVLRACWHALAVWEGTEQRAPQIRIPTLVICGENDAPVLVAGAHRLAELIPTSELCIVAGAAHCPQEETPEAFNAALGAFLRSSQARKEKP